MDLETRVANAVRHFWQVRASQHNRQGTASGVKDYGSRGAVTGGKHLDGFIGLFAELLSEAGLSDHEIHTRSTTLPGYFRPTKDWDLVVVSRGNLIASIEFKAQVGSFGNNFNNRVEEALGNSSDLLTAYREGKFEPSPRPWLGWVMLLEQSEKSMSPVRVSEPHFEVFPEFHGTSYAKRYEMFCQRLVRERLYDGTCFLMSNASMGLDGGYVEPNEELSFKTFASSLVGHASGYVKLRS